MVDPLITEHDTAKIAPMRGKNAKKHRAARVARSLRAPVGRTWEGAARELRWVQSVRFIWEHDRPQLDTAVPSLPDGLVAKLASFAQIPQDSVEIFRNSVSYELGTQWYWASIRPLERAAGSNRTRTAKLQLKRAAKLLRELSEIISDVDQQALKFVLLADWRRHRRSGETWKQNLHQDPGPPPPPPKWDDWVNSRWSTLKLGARDFAELWLEALSIAQDPQYGPQPRPRGRPLGRGSFSRMFSGSLVEFTLRLLFIVRAAGGRLTIDKNSGTGTLPDALGLLRPYLPRGLIPKVLPIGKLERVRTLDRKIASLPVPSHAEWTYP